VDKAGGDESALFVAVQGGYSDDLTGVVATRDALSPQEQSTHHLLSGQLRQPTIGIETGLGETDQLRHVVGSEGTPFQG
jgi:hypothetical protein